MPRPCKICGNVPEVRTEGGAKVVFHPETPGLDCVVPSYAIGFDRWQKLMAPDARMYAFTGSILQTGIRENNVALYTIGKNLALVLQEIHGELEFPVLEENRG